MKTLYWVGTSQEDIRAFPEQARRDAGFELRRVQPGLDPVDWKPIKTIGKGVHEIRVRAGGAFRVINILHSGDAVYVLHAFQKKTAATAKRDLELARQRLKVIAP